MDVWPELHATLIKPCLRALKYPPLYSEKVFTSCDKTKSSQAKKQDLLKKSANNNAYLRSQTSFDSWKMEYSVKLISLDATTQLLNQIIIFITLLLECQK